jgi:hypothetical protein
MKLLLLATLAFSQAKAHGDFLAPPHLDLEMSSAEYDHHLKTLEVKGTLKNREFEDPSIKEAIAIGSRLGLWIAKVNATRTPTTAIRLTSAATRRGIPIERPNSYSPSIIKAELAQALNEAPTSMLSLLMSQGELPDTLPVDDETFIKYARPIDRQYQSAARYRSVDQWRPYYVSAAAKDVRGYYYLTAQKIGPDELRDVTLIPQDKLAPIRDALIKICHNSPQSSLNKCQKETDDAIRSNKLASHYNSYIGDAKRNWDNFFIIPLNARRKDLHWVSEIATVPFNTPGLPKFIPYLQDNIEDEFRYGSWKMVLNFGTFSNGPRLTFKPGVVPHVNGLGGNEIVMDSNQSIEEYESQWTIRHEFGHVIGLPDCYHEFYDTSTQAYVNYQLDITDLMCSRAGNMNERIYLELKKAYKK